MKTRRLSKSDLAMFAGMFYAGLAAIIFFGIWLLGRLDLVSKVVYTVVMIFCGCIAALAVTSKFYGQATDDIKTSLLFGVFIIIIGSVIGYLLIAGDPIMSFYVFVSSVIAGMGTLMLIYSAKK